MPKENKKKLVAIYARVSTDQQELENQLIKLRAYCKQKHYEIHWEYQDIISGGVDNRPQFRRLFEDAYKGLFDIVLFWDLSRFSRSGTSYTINKLEELQRLGIDYISYNEPYLNSMGDFKDVVLSILATVAKIERQKISDRTKAGLARAARKGKHAGRPKGSTDKKKRNRRFHKKPTWGE